MFGIVEKKVFAGLRSGPKQDEAVREYRTPV